MSAPSWISADGLVTAPHLAAADPLWTPAEDVASTPVRATVLTYRRDVASEFVFLLAKRYEVPLSQAVPADELANVIFRRTYERGFRRVEIAKSGWVDAAGGRFFEVALELMHEGMGHVRKIERVAVDGPVVYVLSAEGKPGDLERHKIAIMNWLENARFEAFGLTQNGSDRSAGDTASDAVDPLDSLLDRVDALSARGHDGEALELATATHVRAHLELGDEHPTTVGALFRRGRGLVAIGRLVPGRELLAEAVLRGKTALPVGDCRQAQALAELARASLAEGQLDAAEATLSEARAAIVAGEAAPTPAHDRTAALVDIVAGQIALARRSAQEAERYFQSALTKLRADVVARAAETPDAAPDAELWRVLHQLGRVVGQAGRYAEAEPLLTGALDGRRAAFGDTHPETVESFVSLGTLYTVAKQHHLADPVLRKALELSRRVFGPTHPAVADRLVDVAMTCNALGAGLVAEPLLSEALAIRERHLGADARETAWVRENLESLRKAIAARKPR